MSYNIGTIKEIKCAAWMDVDDVADILENHEDELPEDCFLYELRDRVHQARSVKLTCDCGHKNTKGSKFCNECGSKLPRSKPANRIQLDSINWRCEGSGSTWDFFKTYVAPKIHGEVQGIVVWEDGDSTSGIAIKDGRVEEPDVIQTLDLPKDW